MVEHRNGLRLPLKFKVELWCGGTHYGCFTTRDISYGGVFIEGCQGRLRSGDFVSIKLRTFGATQQVDLLPMRALTVHVSDGGAGLMWADSNESFYRMLDDLVSLAA